MVRGSTTAKEGRGEQPPCLCRSEQKQAEGSVKPNPTGTYFLHRGLFFPLRAGLLPQPPIRHLPLLLTPARAALGLLLRPVFVPRHKAVLAGSGHFLAVLSVPTTFFSQRKPLPFFCFNLVIFILPPYLASGITDE